MSNRLRGHALVMEGVAHTPDGTRKFWYTVGGTGCAKCQCGAVSPEYSGLRQRQQWHRQHKEEIREQQ